MQYDQVAMSRCNLACSGNSAEVCGGSQTISVYYTQTSIKFKFILFIHIVGPCLPP